MQAPDAGTLPCWPWSPSLRLTVSALLPAPVNPVSETRFYGGQAVIEGVMMRGRDVYATAVRRRDGSVVVDRRSVPHFLEGWRIAKWPLVRGTFALIETLTLGIRSLQFSGSVALQDELEAEAAKAPEERAAARPPSRPWATAGVVAVAGAAAVVFAAPKLAPWVAGRVASLGTPEAALLPTRIGLGVLAALLIAALLWRDPRAAEGPQQLDDSALWLAMMPAFAVGIGLFVVLPSWLAGLTKFEGGYGVSVAKNLLEGAIRLAVILSYISLIGRIGQVRRVFQYHGAEHMVINTLEMEGAVSEERAAQHSPLHPRCGTAFLLLFIVLKIVVGCFFGWPEPAIRFALRLAMVPVVAALAYEATRLAGRYRHSPIVAALSGPGLLLQRLTTRAPEPPMIQVAMYALAAVAPEVSLPATWPAAREFKPPTEAEPETPNP